MKKLLLLIAGFVVCAQAQATIISVGVSDFVFNPANITTAKVGDTVRWVWTNGDHTTTSGSIPAGATAWNAPINSANPTFQYKLTVAGTYNYVCTPHAPGMAGTIVVSPAAAGVELAGGNPVRIAPNPASNVLEVSLPNQNQDVAVRLLDMQGRMVYEGSVCSGKTLNISTSDIPTGMYQLSLNLEGQRHSEAVVIRH